jgi:hypothetical protein
MLEERGILLEVTPAARAFLAEQGYDHVYGARPLVHVSSECSMFRSFSLACSDVWCSICC